MNTKDAEADAREEFVRLLAAHTSQLLAFIRVMVFGDGDEADEVYQRTCLVLWRKFEQYDPDGNFAAWATRIAHYEVLKSRASKKKVVLLSEVGLESLAEAALPLAQQVNDRRAALTGCMKKLSCDDLAIVKRRYFDCQSVKEIAQEMDRSRHSIYRTLARVHSMLSRCIQLSMDEDDVGIRSQIHTNPA